MHFILKNPLLKIALVLSCDFTRSFRGQDLNLFFFRACSHTSALRNQEAMTNHPTEPTTKFLDQ